MTREYLTILATLAKCHALINQFALTCKALSTVSDVVHATEMQYLTEGIRVMEFVDADLVQGDAVSWRFEVTFTPIDIAVESDIGKIDGLGYNMVRDIADLRFESTEEWTSAAIVIAQQLVSVLPDELQ